MGITAQEPVELASDPELTPNGHGARTVIDPSLVPDHELDAYREDPNPVTSSNMVTEEALTRPSQPVPMTGMIPQVPNSHAARRYGADPTAMPKTGPVSMPTTSVPLVEGGSRGLFGRGSGGRWGSRRFRSFVRTEEAAPAARAVPSALRSASSCRLSGLTSMSVVRRSAVRRSTHAIP